MESVKKFNSLKEEFEAKQKVMFDELKAEFAKEARVIFDKYPDIESFGCKAYTPYFNDGDVCRWSLNLDADYGISINEQTLNDTFSDKNESNFKYGSKEWDELHKLVSKEYIEVSKFMSQFPEDFYRKCFDEGIITIYRNGIVKSVHFDHD